MAAVGAGSKKPVALYLKLLATINYYVRLECQGDLSLALSHHFSPMSVGRARVDTDFAEKPHVRTSNAFEARQLRGTKKFRPSSVSLVFLLRLCPVICLSLLRSFLLWHFFFALILQ